MKIWILTSRFGNGHRSAALALAEEYRSKGHTVVVSDLVELLYPKQAERIYRVFSRVICRYSWLYNFLNQFGRGEYQIPETPSALQNAFNCIRPDQIITTWSGCGRKLGALPVPVHVCITDLGVHTGWLYPYAAGYWVATREVAEKLEMLNVAAEKIQIRGIPVQEKFRCLPEKTTSYQTKQLLIMGGGLGIIPWLDEFLQDLRGMPDITVTVVAGHNQQLYERLQKEYPWVHTVGFVHNIDDYLKQADFLLSKPGGISLFESIYAATPYIAMYPAYEHELENAEFIEKKQIGIVIHKGESAYWKLKALLADEEQHRTYQTNMANLKHEIEQSRMRFEEEFTAYDHPNLYCTPRSICGVSSAGGRHNTDCSTQKSPLYGLPNRKSAVPNL